MQPRFSAVKKTIMRILVLADIHSNWPALAAIDEQFDACLFIGDLVDYGTNPIPCFEWVKKNVTATVRGNHDHAVAQKIQSAGDKGFRRLAAATRPVHWDVLTATQLKFLGRFPITRYIELDGIRFHLVHATPRDPMDEYLSSEPSEWENRLKNIDADFVCVGHTHRPFHLELENCQVLNPGSVGQPRDGDPRCSYAMIENGTVQIKRIEYDIDETLAQMRTCKLEPWVVNLTEAVLRTGSNLSRKEMDTFL